MSSSLIANGHTFMRSSICHDRYAACDKKELTVNFTSDEKSFVSIEKFDSKLLKLEKRTVTL